MSKQKTKVMDVSLKDIQVGERFRKDYGDIEDLKESIQKFGVLQPIVLDSGHRLVAGGRRFEACTQLGLFTIPAVIRADATDDGVLRELELEENIQRKPMTWQEEVLLVAEIHRLKTQEAIDLKLPWSHAKTAALFHMDRSAVGKDLHLAEGLQRFPEVASAGNKFEAWKILNKNAMEAALAEWSKKQAALAANEEAVMEAMGDDGEVPSGQGAAAPMADAQGSGSSPSAESSSPGVGTPGSGDAPPAQQHPTTWEKGWRPTIKAVELCSSMLKCGDTLAEVKAIPAGFFNFIHADPPYGIDLDKSKEAVDTDHVATFGDTAEWYLENLPAICQEAYRVCAEDGWMVFWFSLYHYEATYQALVAAGWSVNRLPAIWQKNTGRTLSPHTSLNNMYETFFVCRKGRAQLSWSGSGNIFTFSHAKKKFHSTQKPVDMLEKLLSLFTMGPRQKVFDMFLGSGSMAVACMKQRLVYHGFELSPHNHAAAVNWFKDYFLRGMTDE